MKLRKHRRLSYSHPHRFEDEFTNVMHHALTQYTLKAGMRHYKERGEKGVTAEMKQIQEKLTFKPVNKSSLTTDQRANDLHALMFPKEMRTGKIKGRMCADGRKQQKKSDKKSATSRHQLPNQYSSPRKLTLLRAATLPWWTPKEISSLPIWTNK